MHPTIFPPVSVLFQSLCKNCVPQGEIVESVLVVLYTVQPIQSVCIPEQPLPLCIEGMSHLTCSTIPTAHGLCQKMTSLFLDWFALMINYL